MLKLPSPLALAESPVATLPLALAPVAVLKLEAPLALALFPTAVFRLLSPLALLIPTAVLPLPSPEALPVQEKLPEVAAPEMTKELVAPFILTPHIIPCAAAGGVPRPTMSARLSAAIAARDSDGLRKKYGFMMRPLQGLSPPCTLLQPLGVHRVAGQGYRI